ncbi:MAG: sensor protein KdpD [Saprospiraceae bacterium]|nr:sensor protein KdpD [Saprospiraceae bacterium]
MDAEKQQNVQRFLDLLKKSKRGKFKIYIGMSAGVGKTYRMLQEAHTMHRLGVDVRIAYVETHNRAETAQLVEGLPVIPRKKVFYKGRELEEMDVQAVIRARPEVVIVDELAHTNVEGGKNQKRWQDVLEILDAGISVISAVNIQHLESLNRDVLNITGIEVQERVPDKVLAMADEVVNIDLTSDELIARLREGKIYPPEKIATALNNFFTGQNILQLRELALKEVATQVERKVETELPKGTGFRHEKFLACISTNERTARNVIRKTARLASYYNSKWWVLYIQTPAEAPDRIALDKQRHLINNFKLATELGAEVVRVQHNHVARAIMTEAENRGITTICMGKPHFNLMRIILFTSVFNELLNKLSTTDIDLVILS